MKHRIVLAAATSAFALTAATVTASAGGFQLNERSTRALGASLSGATSAASDVSFMGFNPAALSTVQSIEVGGNLALVSPIAETEFAGQDIDADQIGIVPGFAAGYRLNESVTLGVTSYTPFGLVTDYDDTPITAIADTSRLTTVVVAPTVAWEITPRIALGASFNVIYADARLTNSTLALTGDTIDFGFSAGALFRPTDSTQIGLAYHHGYDLSLDGDNQVFGVGTFGMEAEAELPAWVGLGITQEISDDVRIMAEGRWIGWDSFDTIDVSTPTAPLPPLQNIQEVQNYEDSFFVGVGAEYDMNEKLTLRGGVAYDDTPTTDEFRTPRVPDSDRLWLSAGASYAVSDSMTLDASYSYLHGLEEAEVNTPLGTLEYDGGAHIFSVGGSIRF